MVFQIWCSNDKNINTVFAGNYFLSIKKKGEVFLTNHFIAFISERIDILKLMNWT